VNLARMVDRVAALAPVGFDRVLAEALAIRDEELAASISMGEYGADLIEALVDASSFRTMTICNTGGSPPSSAAPPSPSSRHCSSVRLAEALPLETRPLLQGGRLTTWELQQMGAPFRLIVDSAGPFLLSRGGADVVLAGADRIAANGDTANKIGTFSLALAARHAGVPFLIVAPESTVDLDTATGDDIEIEDRGPTEVATVGGHRIAPDGIDAINPAFDVTPSRAHHRHRHRSAGGPPRQGRDAATGFDGSASAVRRLTKHP
jgi:methylthioribose-1-phosphate isomerase